MSAHNGDKARFHRLRKKKIARREERRRARAQQSAEPAKASKDSDQ